VLDKWFLSQKQSDRQKEGKSSSVNCWDSDITQVTSGKNFTPSSDAGSEAAMLKTPLASTLLCWRFYPKAVSTSIRGPGFSHALDISTLQCLDPGFVFKH